MRRAIIVQGLYFGDEGKGSIVDFLCSKQSGLGKVDLVVRHNGGCQAAHNVVLPDGRHHCFSQFGSGTLQGVPTFLDRHMIVDPLAMRCERKHLEELGFNPQIYIHADCLVTTVYHRNLNRIQDGINKHGSCGLGIGATRKMWSQTGDGLRFSDLFDRKILKRKLDWIRQWCRDQLMMSYAAALTENHEVDINHAEEVQMLQGTVRSETFLTATEVASDGIVIFEGAQGFGLDERFGTVPHTTYSDTTPTYAMEYAQHADRLDVIGVIRSYGTRHGNGPLYGEDMLEPQHDPREHNKGGFAGTFRSSDVFDRDLLTRAIGMCGITSVAVNHLDYKPMHKPTRQFIESLVPVSIEGYGPTAADKKIVMDGFV